MDSGYMRYELWEILPYRIHSEEGGLYAANTGTEHGKKHD